MNYRNFSTKARRIYTADYRCKWIDQKTGIQCGCASQAVKKFDLHDGQSVDTTDYYDQFCKEHADDIKAKSEAKRDGIKQNVAVTKQRFKENVLLTVKAEAAGERALAGDTEATDEPNARHGDIFMSLSDKRSSLAWYYRSSLDLDAFDAGHIPVLAIAGECLKDASSRRICIYIKEYMNVLREAGVGVRGGEVYTMS